MTALFKDLTARLPQLEDRVALTELLHVCGDGAESVPEGILDGLGGNNPQLAYHAWVIVAARGQLVGFACVWREDHERMTMYLCVHPDYRARGIGTVLLRIAEMRARQLARQAPTGQRVILQGLIQNANERVQCLFQREGYTPGRAFLRISCLFKPEDHVPGGQVARAFTVDVHLVRPAEPLGATALSEQDVLCSVQRYECYEKELRPASSVLDQRQVEMQTLGWR